MVLDPLAFLELFVVLMFAVAWGILELVGKRLDRQRIDRDRIGEARPAMDADVTERPHDGSVSREP